MFAQKRQKLQGYGEQVMRSRVRSHGRRTPAGSAGMETGESRHLATAFSETVAWTIQQLARHKSLTMTDAYARAIPERVERAVEDLGEAIQKSKASSAVVKSLTCGEMKKAAGAESLQQQPLNSSEDGGGGGNRTPVPRPFHVSFYRNSPLFVSRPSVSKGQDTSGPASGVFRAFARRPRSGAILYCGLRPGFSEEKESGEGAALLGSHFEIAVTSYVFPGVL